MYTFQAYHSISKMKFPDYGGKYSVTVSVVKNGGLGNF